MVPDTEEGPGDSDGSREIAYKRSKYGVNGEGRGEGLPSGDENAYAALVASRKNKLKNTKTLVQTPAPCVCLFTPNASKAVRKTSTVVHPWYNEKGKCTKISSASPCPL